MSGSTVVLTLLLKAFTKLAHCATLVYASVRYNNLHISTLHLVISYNEDNTKLLLTLFLEVFSRTCILHYTSFRQLRQTLNHQPDTSRRANTGVFQDPVTASSFPMPLHESKKSLCHLFSSTPLCRKKLRGYDAKANSRSRVHSHSSGLLV